MSAQQQLTNMQKIRMLDDLIRLRVHLTWAAQRPSESVWQFNQRMSNLLHEYNNLGKIAQVEFVEVVQDSYQRERLAIYTYIRGLRADIKRYICKEEIYKSLDHAMQHAKLIDYHLKDLKKLRK